MVAKADCHIYRIGRGEIAVVIEARLLRELFVRVQMQMGYGKLRARS